MLLTLAKPTKSEFDFKNPHEYSPVPSFSSRFSPKVTGSSLRSLPVGDLSAPSTMTTPHRGLPPPAAMTLPDPGRGPPPPLPPPGQMPAPPAQWQGAEESMRNWLMAKAEEDKRKQEEEKTRQEGYRLEQRKIEQSMLRESMQGGIPPPLVPMIFAGIGGGGLANLSTEWLQQYFGQLQAAQQQQQQQQMGQSQVSPELRRETRLINPSQSNVYGQTPPSSQQTIPAGGVPPSQAGPQVPSQHGAFSTSVYGTGNMSPQTRSRASTVSGQSGLVHTSTKAQPGLPRLTTNEMQIHAPPSAPSNVHTMQQSQASQEQQTSSPSIYFHHWVPPTSQVTSGSNPPATPSDYSSSPKKRKAQGTHQAAPAPTSAPQFGSSPQFSQSGSTSSGRRGHGRTRSDTSARAYEGRPGSRHGPASRRGHADSGPPAAELSQQGIEEERSSSVRPGSASSFSRSMSAAQGETRVSEQTSRPAGASVPSSPKREPGGGA